MLVKSPCSYGFFFQGPTFWVNCGATEACSPEPWNHGLDIGESSPHDRTIQVSELLY